MVNLWSTNNSVKGTMDKKWLPNSLGWINGRVRYECTALAAEFQANNNCDFRDVKKVQ